MNPSIYVAVTGAIAALVTAALTYAFTKRREREADWRKLKLDMYREFAIAMAGMAEGDAGGEERTRFNLACNSLHLIASKHTVDALEAFRYEIRASNVNRSSDEHDRLLSRLFWEIRRDLGDVPTEHPEDFKVKLYTSGKTQS
jgi:hypothetical protein